MWRSYLDIFIAILIDAFSTVLIFMHVDFPIIRIAVGFLLVFFVPGYVLSIELFPENKWPLVERIVLTIGLSMVISILGGLLLSALSIPLQENSWMTYLGSVTLIFSCMAAYRRYRLSQLPARRVKDIKPLADRFPAPNPGQLLLIGLSVMIALGAVALSHWVAMANPRTEVVQLWILPGDQKNGPNVRLGVMANESSPTEFSVWLGRDGFTVQEWPRLELKPGEMWEVTIPIEADIPGNGPLEAFLYLYGQPDIPYRHVILWLDQLGSNE